MERATQHGKKEGFHEMERQEDKQETQTGEEHTEWTDTSWDYADNWTVKRLEHRFADRPAWEQAARRLPPTQPAQEECDPTHGGSISMLGF